MVIKLIGIAAISMAIIISVIVYNTKVNKEDNLLSVKGINYDKVIEQGFKSQGLSLQDILYEKSVGDNKIIFFTSQEALGLAYMGKDKDEWTFNRISALTDFVTDYKHHRICLVDQKLKLRMA